MKTVMAPTTVGIARSAGELNAAIAAAKSTGCHIESDTVHGGRARVERVTYAIPDQARLFGYDAEGSGYLLTGQYLVVDNRRVQTCAYCGEAYTPCVCGKDW